MDYTGDGQIVHAFNPNGQRERLRVPLFGGDIVHVVRKYENDDGTGKLLSETVELTSVARDAGWAWDESSLPKPKPKRAKPATSP